MKTRIVFLIVPIILLIPLPSQGADYQAFWGNLHSHTSYSDGVGLPSDAFEYARYTAGLDFRAVTDHAAYLCPHNPSPPYNRWPKLRAHAHMANENGEFVAIAGYEYTNMFSGHLNVFATDELIWVPKAYYLWEFYKMILDLEGVVVQFNHPYGEEYFDNWYDFYHAGIPLDVRISLIEADGLQENFERGYIRALEKGWHVAPVANQDNHGWDWGTLDSRRAGVWIESLTRKNVLQCLRERRCFSTSDENAWIRLKGNGKWMGRFTRDRPVHLEIKICDDPDDPWDRMELIGPGGEIVGTEYPDSSSFTWEITEYPADDYFWYAKAYQLDGELLISAPIWYIPPD